MQERPQRGGHCSRLPVDRPSHDARPPVSTIAISRDNKPAPPHRLSQRSLPGTGPDQPNGPALAPATIPAPKETPALTPAPPTCTEPGDTNPTDPAGHRRARQADTDRKGVPDHDSSRRRLHPHKPGPPTPPAGYPRWRFGPPARGLRGTVLSRTCAPVEVLGGWCPRFRQKLA
jgi:hypothetical protein